MAVIWNIFDHVFVRAVIGIFVRQLFKSTGEKIMARKNYTFAHIHDDKYYASEDVSADVRRLTDLLEVIFDDASTKRSAIEVNSRLTHQGKSEAREELKGEIKKARTGWLDRLTPLDDQVASIQKEMVLTSHQPDDVVSALREWEMRSGIQKMDPVDLRVAYERAAENGDDLFVNAVENSPIPFVFDKQEDLVEQVRQARLERRFPEQASKLKDLNLGLANLQSALRSVESNFRAQGLEIADDSVSDRAGLRVA